MSCYSSYQVGSSLQQFMKEITGRVDVVTMDEESTAEPQEE